MRSSVAAGTTVVTKAMRRGAAHDRHTSACDSTRQKIQPVEAAKILIHRPLSWGSGAGGAKESGKQPSPASSGRRDGTDAMKRYREGDEDADGERHLCFPPPIPMCSRGVRSVPTSVAIKKTLLPHQSPPQVEDRAASRRRAPCRGSPRNERGRAERNTRRACAAPSPRRRGPTSSPGKRFR